jgi:hypothetical protein
MSGKKIKTFVDTPAQSFKNKTSFKRFFRNLPGFGILNLKLNFFSWNIPYIALNYNLFKS